MNEKIKELALESELAYRRSDGRCWIDAGFVDADFERFAELVAEYAAAKEREACAKLCDDWLVGRDDICELAKAIRARSKHD